MIKGYILPELVQLGVLHDQVPSAIHFLSEAPISVKPGSHVYVTIPSNL